MLHIGDPLPDALVATTRGEIDLRRFQGAGWLVIFGYPADFTAVCSTELAAAAARAPEFARRMTSLLAIGTSEVDTHRRWVSEIERGYRCRVQVPIVADPGGALSENLGLVHPADPARPSRVTYVVGPHQTVSAVVAYPAAVGRDWDELLRLCDALRLRAMHGLSAPAGWRPGDPALIPSALSNHEADHRYRGWWSTEDGRRLVEVPRLGGVADPA
jgi:alkyl hydroperoxide reductase subunit AhpC